MLAVRRVSYNNDNRCDHVKVGSAGASNLLGWLVLARCLLLKVSLTSVSHAQCHGTNAHVQTESAALPINLLLRVPFALHGTKLTEDTPRPTTHPIMQS